MRTDERRWPRATAISIALHGLVVLVVWLAATRADRIVVFTPDDFGPRFEPGAVLPIELAAATTDRIADEPRDGTGVDERSVEAREPERVVHRGADPRPSAMEPEPTPSGSLHEHERGTGLLSSGREARAFDPTLLRGSRSIYDESAASRPEGPQPRPNSHFASPPGDDDYRFEREGNEWIYRVPGGTFVASLQPDGSVDFRNKIIKVKVGSMPSVARDGEEFITLDVKHDAVAVAQLARGRDPNERVKAKLLAETFEFRLEIATKHAKQRLIDQLGQLEEELEGIWSASGRSLAERKRLLFERWDACEEEQVNVALEGFPDADTSALDETRRKLASAARRKILRFIAKVAPVGSPEAFTEAELAAYNQRRVSTQAFAPYD